MRRTKSGIILPDPQPVTLDLQRARLTYYGRALLRKADPEGITEAGRFLLGIQNMAGASDYSENKTLNHLMGKEAWTMPTTVALALTTVTPTDSMTGATITEPTYTGYARKVIAAAALSAASGGEIKNAEALTFAECTAGSSTIIGFAVCDSSTKGAGNALAWGTITSTAISTTQTPPNVPANALVITAD